MKFESGTFDAVFAMTLIHQVEDWRKAISEISRVLKVGGYFVIDDLNKTAVDMVRWLGFKHPKGYYWKEFREQLERAGFQILEEKNMVVPVFKAFLCRKIK
jgi:ubiquinone/menaquinone biosynthesis C-methylase UbiE